MRSIFAAVSVLALAAACGPTEPAKPVALAPSATANADLQKLLIEAQPGDTIEIGAGTFDFTEGLSLTVDDVTIKGAGIDKTILSFKGQKGAGEGLLVTSDGVRLTGFTMQDSKGDGIKSKGADDIIYKDLKVEWTGGPKAENGAYGVYPVESKNVLIDGVTVSGASDAGIYVGQSDNIIVRNSRAEFNVAGIEIENSSRADVYDNVATKNAGGILVFDLPDLPKKDGHSTRVFNNQIIENDTPNFAPPGNIVAGVPTGTGVLLMANKNVHVFNNTFDKNKTTHVMVVAYSNEFKDTAYNPLPRDFVIRDNTYGEGGNDPQGRLAPLAPAIGGKLPPIVWDGVTKYGDVTGDVKIVVREKPEVGFINLGLGSTPPDLTKAKPSTERQPDVALEEPPAVVLPERAKPKKEGA
ncbi:MAG TPA: parallel beta-helix domain-containing protein [Hyphomonadaceae bacterium]|nr:parallel beta-helix domain-containing protein [Hyphomonadaceae bacterium]HPN06996.1 parallel beta-helix domain-containing protein [Hyphomonadaceae bacterium]